MISLLAKRLIPNYTAYSEPAVRRGYGVLCSVVGIVLNLLLCGVKFLAGTLSGAIAITADALNNLSDAASSCVTLLGFWLGGKAADSAHPFGHGRYEYLAGLGVSVLILWMGVELGISSVRKLFAPSDVTSGWLVPVILGISALVKLYMYYYNHRIARNIASAAMEATAADSRSDALSTLVVLVSTLVTAYTGLRIDGICGIFVSLLILRTGYEAARDTISPLLGQPPSRELVAEITGLVLAQEEIVGMHDLLVHDYGPGRMMISLHAEVRGDRDIFLLHDVIDQTERALAERFSCDAVIHMDPIAVDDAVVSQMRKAVAAVLEQLDPVITMHDFRMVQGHTHTNLIFDVVVPFSFRMTDAELKTAIERHIAEHFTCCYAIVKIDKSYLS